MGPGKRPAAVSPEVSVNGVANAKLMPEAHRLVTVSADNCLRLWDLGTAEWWPASAARGLSGACAVLPDGRDVLRERGGVAPFPPA